MATVDAFLLGLVAISALYWTVALACASTFRSHRAPSRFCPPVTILKPLCGSDDHLYANLRSFCEQAYPCYHVVFGVRDADDAAVAVVERLMRESPTADLALVVTDGPRSGTNRKVVNLAGLMESAKHDVIVIADSDIRVGSDYLRRVVAPLEDPSVGLVTCLYRGVSGSGWWGRLAAMFINEWFFPSALMSAKLEGLRHAFGATIALRRDALVGVGGFEALTNYLADDYMLGRLVARRYRAVLSPYVVETTCVDRDWSRLLFHELRWTRTFRTVRPLPYALSIITHGIPLVCLLLVTAGPTRLVLAAAAIHATLRVAGRSLLYRTLGLPAPWSTTWLVPLRDALSFGLWMLSFMGGSVRWNGERLRVDSDGRLHRREADETAERVPIGAKRAATPAER